MSLREELSELMRVRSNLNSSSMGEPTVTIHDELAWAEQSADFLRDHGQALLEAVEWYEIAAKNGHGVSAVAVSLIRERADEILAEWGYTDG